MKNFVAPSIFILCIGCVLSADGFMRALADLPDSDAADDTVNLDPVWTGEERALDNVDDGPYDVDDPSVDDDADDDELEDILVRSLDAIQKRKSSTGALTKSQKNAILAAHNEARRAVSPTAADMKVMVSYHVNCS